MTQAVIWKYPLALGRAQRLQMPRGARILDVQLQDGEPVLWALCDPLQSTPGRVIVIYGTGETITLPDGTDTNTAHLLGMAYIATFQQGPYVWHAFEERE